MTRKLAVTVFAMSLTLVGCGSSSTTKPDVGADTKITPADVAIKLDVVTTPDVSPIKLDVAADVTVQPDTTPVTPDAAKDVVPSQDTGDAGSQLDVAKLDVAGSEVIKADASDAAKIDAPDAGPVIDAPAVDAGTSAKCSGTPLTITYDGTATPDSPAFATVFSSQVFPGTSWSVADGALAMTSVAGKGLWFGNHDSYDPVSWKFATWDQGNTLTIRCKLGPSSQGFHFYFYNTAPEPSIFFMPGYVMLNTVAVDGRRDIDTSVYHTYGVSQNGSRRIWSIDGVEVANEALSTAASTKTPYVIIGDGSGPDPGTFGYETGTFYISEVVIKTYTSCTP